MCITTQHNLIKTSEVILKFEKKGKESFYREYLRAAAQLFFTFMRALSTQQFQMTFDEVSVKQFIIGSLYLYRLNYFSTHMPFDVMSKQIYKGESTTHIRAQGPT